jgi:hypothetical protein
MPICVALLGVGAAVAAAATPTPPATTIATEAASTLARFVTFFIIIDLSLPDQVDRATYLFGTKRSRGWRFTKNFSAPPSARNHHLRECGWLLCAGLTSNRDEGGITVLGKQWPKNTAHLKESRGERR